jgi:hypothetical protein
VYRAEWDGTGTVAFGLDAVTIASGRTAAGRNFADLQVTPSDNGIYLRIDATSPTDPVRDFHVWMPDWQGQRFAGQRWQPGDSFSPFHPLFLQRLKPFHTIRFMGMQETNSSSIRSWADRRDALDIRQGSGAGGTPSEPIVNGMSVEYMVQLANDLNANPWFNMPHMADDDFVRNFATYVRDHLKPGLTASVEWSNEIWNFGWGFEASQWVSEQTKLPANAGLDNWQVAGHEAKRDLDIWSDVFAGQNSRLVRVAAGWAAVDWVTNRIVESMGGSFDAIAIAPSITPTDEQRAAYTSATTVDRVIADTRANIATSLEWVGNHERLAQDWQRRLGRPIKLVAYEGGPHLDGRNASYQNAFYAATNDARMGDISRDYLRGLDAAGMDLYVDFQFTGYAGATPWGDFAKLHRMDEPLTAAHRYRAVVAAADGSLWNPVAPPLPVVGIAGATIVEGHLGRRLMTFVLTLSAPSATPVTVRWNTVNGTATAGRDYVAGGGTVTFAPGQTRRAPPRPRRRFPTTPDRACKSAEPARSRAGSPVHPPTGIGPGSIPRRLRVDAPVTWRQDAARAGSGPCTNGISRSSSRHSSGLGTCVAVSPRSRRRMGSPAGSRSSSPTTDRRTKRCGWSRSSRGRSISRSRSPRIPTRVSGSPAAGTRAWPRRRRRMSSSPTATACCRGTTFASTSRNGGRDGSRGATACGSTRQRRRGSPRT